MANFIGARRRIFNHPIGEKSLTTKPKMLAGRLYSAFWLSLVLTLYLVCRATLQASTAEVLPAEPVMATMVKGF